MTVPELPKSQGFGTPLRTPNCAEVRNTIKPNLQIGLQRLFRTVPSDSEQQCSECAEPLRNNIGGTQASLAGRLLTYDPAKTLTKTCGLRSEVRTAKKLRWSDFGTQFGVRNDGFSSMN